MANRLSSEKSPYLLQHGENPVDWYPWCEEAFGKAEQEDKPVFLSIGYSTCHWCHVMAHESFEDEEIARILNEHFISIKVDREERPDVDAVYMAVCQAATGSGGWPLTVLLTPGQKPFFVGTYFSKNARYGQPGLKEILEKVVFLWQNNRKELLETGERLTEELSGDHAAGNDELNLEILKEAVQQYERQFDRKWGGFGLAPKFPSAHNLLFLMRYAWSEKDDKTLYMAEVTLQAMTQGGIHDQIGGGFSRYSTDREWMVPHFEKMLYDNALLLQAYLYAFQITGKRIYEDTARRTADYILRELTDEQGGFYCGQDADSDGVEGKYYVFTPQEIRAVLGKTDGEEFCGIYGITEEGNFEGKNIPWRAAAWREKQKMADKPEEKDKRETMDGSDKGEKLEAAYGPDKKEQRESLGCWERDDPRLGKLYRYRLGRTGLHKDDKILLSWNGWTICALARAGMVLGEERYLECAKKAQRFIEEHMTTQGNRLYRRFRDGEAAHMGQLEDYGVYALALLELYHVTFEAEYLVKAAERARQMREYFEDTERGGYYITPTDGERLIIRPKETYDGALPSGNSVAAMVLHKLFALTGEREWQEAADRQLGFMMHEADEYPSGYSFTLLAVAEAMYPHWELVCTVREEVPEELKDYLKKNPAYGVHILAKTMENKEKLAQCAGFTREYPVPENKEPLYYLCENGACGMAVKEFEKLKN